MKNETENLKKTLTKPFVLVGMMGAGKTHYGQDLAKALDLKFYDSDRIIEEKAGQSIPDIFENYGEGKFRDSEQKTILELLEQGPCVLATGGGALGREATLSTLKEQSIMIWLNTPFDLIWERVQKSQNRPLLHTENPQEKLKSLMAERAPLYAQAHIEMKMDKATSSKGSETIIKALLSHLNGDIVSA